MKFYCSHHRFNFLKYSSIFQNEVTNIYNFPIPKTCLFENSNAIAMIEYTDGIDGLVTSIEEKKNRFWTKAFRSILLDKTINKKLI